MSQRCVIPDAFKFAAEGRPVEGKVAVAALSRLVDLVDAPDGEVSYAVVGAQGADGRWELHLALEGVLQLKCQRCLAGMKWPFEIRSVLLLVRSQDEIPEDELEDASRDAIEVLPDMDVLALVEDEILLAVPVVPRHERCEPPAPAGGSGKESPFAVLAGLRKPGESR